MFLKLHIFVEQAIEENKSERVYKLLDDQLNSLRKREERLGDELVELRKKKNALFQRCEFDIQGRASGGHRPSVNPASELPGAAIVVEEKMENVRKCMVCSVALQQLIAPCFCFENCSPKQKLL